MKEGGGDLRSTPSTPRAGGRPRSTPGGRRRTTCTWRRSRQGSWTHLAVASDGATMRVYLNGVQVGATPRGRRMPKTSGPLRIAGNSVWDDEFFDGTIDDVRVYNRALSQAEIVGDSEAPVGGGSDRAGGHDAARTCRSPRRPEVQRLRHGERRGDRVGRRGRAERSVQAGRPGPRRPDTAAPYPVSWTRAPRRTGRTSSRAVARDAAGQHADRPDRRGGDGAERHDGADGLRSQRLRPGPPCRVRDRAATRRGRRRRPGRAVRLDGQNLGAADTSAPTSSPGTRAPRPGRTS